MASRGRSVGPRYGRGPGNPFDGIGGLAEIAPIAAEVITGARGRANLDAGEIPHLGRSVPAGRCRGGRGGGRRARGGAKLFHSFADGAGAGRAAPTAARTDPRASPYRHLPDGGPGGESAVDSRVAAQGHHRGGAGVPAAGRITQPARGSAAFAVQIGGNHRHQRRRGDSGVAQPRQRARRRAVAPRSSADQRLVPETDSVDDDSPDGAHLWGSHRRLRARGRAGGRRSRPRPPARADRGSRPAPGARRGSRPGLSGGDPGGRQPDRGRRAVRRDSTHLERSC